MALKENIIIGCALILVSLNWFARMPFYRIPSPDNTILRSPAEGYIIEHRPGYTSIFLTVLDVHYQFAPVTAKVIKQHYTPGTFYPIYFFNKSKYNERLETLFETSDGRRVLVMQIAGQIARRIESYVKIGSHIQQGQVMGMIRLGSRVDIYYDPQHYEYVPELKANHKVKIGTPLALKT